MSVYVPYPDRDSAPWWDALSRHELVHQRCSDCGRWRWPPRAMCGDCGSFEWTWEPCSGRGRVVTWIVTHHKFSAAHAAGPTVTVFVAPEEQDDIVMPGRWEPGAEAPPTTGMRVSLVYDDVAGEDGRTATLLAWRPA